MLKNDALKCLRVCTLNGSDEIHFTFLNLLAGILFLDPDQTLNRYVIRSKSV